MSLQNTENYLPLEKERNTHFKDQLFFRDVFLFNFFSIMPSHAILKLWFAICYFSV